MRVLSQHAADFRKLAATECPAPDERAQRIAARAAKPPRSWRVDEPPWVVKGLARARQNDIALQTSRRVHAKTRVARASRLARTGDGERLATGRPEPAEWLLEQLKDERRRLVGLRQDGDACLLEDLGAHEFAHAAGDVRIGDAAVRRGGVLRGHRDGAAGA